MEQAKTKEAKSFQSKRILSTLLPVVALAALLIIFCVMVTAKGYRLGMYMKVLFNEAVVLSVVSTGAVFIYALGTFDISLGASTLFAATMGVMAYNATNSMAVMILAILASGIGCSLFNSVLASVFHIPAFVTTVAMMSVLSAIAGQIITTNGGAVGGISIPSEVVKGLDNMPFKIVVLVIWLAFCMFIFNHTKFGRREKFAGGNALCAELTGIKYNSLSILGFTLAGVGVGIGAFLTLVYTPSVTTTTAGSIGMNIMVAIVFGGMPISGGPHSKIYSAVIGSFSYITMNNILNLLIDSSSGYGITQIVSAAFFLAVVYVASMNYRTQLLPR